MNARERNEVRIFSAALDFTSSSARAAYLDQACHGDARLRQRVEELLRVQAEAEGFFGSSAAGDPVVEAANTAVVGAHEN